MRLLLLVGNIRVYCRIRPFLPGQNEKQTTIEYIGENGELVVVNPLKPGKDSRRLFKFNKVFAPTASQGFCHLYLFGVVNVFIELVVCVACYRFSILLRFMAGYMEASPVIK